MRTITNLKNPNDNYDFFDYFHKMRFLIFSIVDLLNGLSVLYCFHAMASLANRQRITSSSQNLVRETSDNPEKLRESINEMLINRMKMKEVQTNKKSKSNIKYSGRMLSHLDKNMDKSKLMKIQNRQLFQMLENNDENNSSLSSC
jgi:uncharacterized protein (DUF2225 family)